MKKGLDYTGVAVAFLCHDGAVNFLMGKRSDTSRDEIGTWDVGAGALEFGDRVEERLKKEIKEEYSTDVLDYEFLGYRDAHRQEVGRDTHWIGLDFKVLVDREKVKNGEPHKLAEIDWFTLDSLPEPLHSQNTEFFEKYKSKLRLGL